MVHKNEIARLIQEYQLLISTTIGSYQSDLLTKLEEYNVKAADLFTPLMNELNKNKLKYQSYLEQFHELTLYESIHALGQLVFVSDDVPVKFYSLIILSNFGTSYMQDLFYSPDSEVNFPNTLLSIIEDESENPLIHFLTAIIDGYDQFLEDNFLYVPFPGEINSLIINRSLAHHELIIPYVLNEFEDYKESNYRGILYACIVKLARDLRLEDVVPCILAKLPSLRSYVLENYHEEAPSYHKYDLSICYNYIEALGFIGDPLSIPLLIDIIGYGFLRQPWVGFTIEDKIALAAAEALLLIDEVQPRLAIQQIIDESYSEYIERLERFLENWIVS